jgi:hypothetical protein
MLTAVDEFKLTDRQNAAISLFASDASYVLLYGGSRSTKTFTIIRNIVNRALMADGSRHAVLRFRFNHVKNSVVLDTFPKVMELCFPGCKYSINKSDWYATLPNGSEIWFGGLDDKERTEKILGNEYVTVFLNECSQISYSSFLLIVTRLAQKCHFVRGGERKEMRLKFFCDENPLLQGHWTHRLFIEKKDPTTKKALALPDNYATLQMNPADNADNLPKEYLANLDGLPKRQRDRFYLGKFGSANDNALWTADIIEKSRVTEAPDMVRVVVAVDPSGASDDEEESNDDIGIIVGGLGVDGNAYILEDVTIHAAPATWGKVAASAYERHEADRVIGEVNFGGAMVEFVIKTANPSISYKAVNASRSKMVRAEPVSALHETGKVKLVGNFPDLEDEMLASTTTGYTGSKSPNRLDAFVFVITELFPSLVRGKPKERSNRPRSGTSWMG